jgi:formylglycine-generating enzyme required for sulfatase activity/tRNA A-37 threonylcarbamoyl transferase component Bud32
MENFIGQSIGRYQIIESIGRGGMAIVYRAYDTRLENYVAVKVIRKDAFSQNDFERISKRFEQEAKLTASLAHPNIVKVIDYGEFNGYPFLVMPYISNETLRDRLGKPLPWKEAITTILPIAKALSYAHKHGSVHRDVKPSNILISETGEPMLSDFGVAKVLFKEETQDFTTVGVGVGTPEYMAPEQGLGQNIDGRADLYALAIILFEMLSGTKPYRATTPLAVILKQINDPLPNLFSLRPDVPDRLGRVINKALSKNRDHRYADMDAFINALEDLLLLSDRKVKILAPFLRTKFSKLAIFLTSVVLIAALFIFFLVLKMNPADTTSNEAKLTNEMVPKDNLLAEQATTQLPTTTKYIVASPSPMMRITPTLGVGSKQDRSIDEMVMMYIPAGKFLMGSDHFLENQSPAHTVFLNAFWIDQTEITNAMYYRCVDSGSCTEPAYLFSYTREDYYYNKDYSDFPVIYVSWKQANVYCDWVGGRLPTEAEWEKAARGVDNSDYTWGNTAPDCSMMNFNDCYGDTLEVKSNQKDYSSYGVYDMGGNVAEWVADWYKETAYDQKEANNPTGPNSGVYRSVRGASWHSQDAMATVRTAGYPIFTDDEDGFRCAFDE